MSRTIRAGRSALAVVAVVAVLVRPVAAGFLDPLAYSSQGAFTAASTATYHVTETPGSGVNPGAVTLDPLNGGAAYTAVISNGVAVFDFDSISLAAGSAIYGAVLDPRFSIPVAFLSRGDVNIAGTINFSPPGFLTTIYAGPGGGSGQPTIQGPGSGAGGSSGRPADGGGGAGFGGNGGQGGAQGQVPMGPTGFERGNPGGSGGGSTGGPSYGNLAVALQGGSPGGSGVKTFDSSGKSYGGSGAGGIEIGALGRVTVSGAIRADGEIGMAGDARSGGGGGGSGGGILIHADAVTISGALTTVGGAGGRGGTFDPVSLPGAGSAVGGGGGGGGGGQILIAYGAGGYDPTGALLDLHGGLGGLRGVVEASDGLNGGAGAVTLLNAVPEPSAWVSLAFGVCGLLAYRKARACS